MSRTAFRPSYRGFLSFCDAVGYDQLAPHQRRIARAVFEGPEREVVAVLPRGNDKTTTAALIGLHHLIVTPGASIAVGAASRDQARILFERMSGFAEHPALDGELTVRHLELRAEGGGLLRVIPADGPRAHGLSPTLCLADEVWAWKDSGELLEALQTALVKRPDARLLAISTSAARMDTPLGRWRARALAQADVRREGVVLEARGQVRWLEWSAPEGADPDDYRLAARVNPASRFTPAAMRDARGRVGELTYRQFHLCQFGVSEAQWLPAGAWQACRDPEPVPEDEPVVLGIDVGGSRAASAVIGVTRDLRVAEVHVHQGDEAVLEVTTTVEEIASRRPIIEAAYDPWRFRGEALRLERDQGLTMVEFPQSHARMVPASETLHAAIVERRLRHPGHPELNRHVAGAIAKSTGRGWRLEQSERSAQIDGVIALAMAAERASAPLKAPTRLIGWV